MVIEELPPPFLEWFGGAAIQWLRISAVLVLAAAGLTLVASMIRSGPLAGLRQWARGAAGGLADLVRISPRRVLALAGLAVRESIHRRVIVAFGLFVLVLLFAGWYLDQTSRNQAQLYLSFVMTTTSYLVLLLVLFLSVFSLPSDIAQRTIHTIVTKPVRASEIILGRILGFVITGTVLLAITGVISYVFVVRGLEHTHAIEVATFEEVPPRPGAANPIVKRGQTARQQGHSHEVVIYADGTGDVIDAFGHDHELLGPDDPGTGSYALGGPRGMLVARVPIYGRLTFYDRLGAARDRGDNTGDEWTYRSYIEGGSLAAAVWTFEGVGPSQFPDGLPLEMTLQVFRTYKGDVERPIQGALRLRNPRTGLLSQPRYFSAREFYVASEFLPRRMLDSEGRAIDIFTDLVDNGRIEVEVKCLDPEQFLGMAPADVYLRAAEASFAANFAKGYLGIWLQMTLVTTVGVMFSTFLNGAVAMLATVAVMLGGFFAGFIRDLASGKTLGGGPLESMVRLVTQRNLIIDLEETAGTRVVKLSDQVFQAVLRSVSALLPEFGTLSDIDYVANGYDIPASILSLHIVTAFAYLLPVFVVAYLLFRAREVAR